MGAVSCSQLLAHDGNLNSAPWDACEDKQQSNVCAFTNSQEDIYRGTCQVMAESLYCVRNQPIIRAEELEIILGAHAQDHEDDHHH